MSALTIHEVNDQLAWDQFYAQNDRQEWIDNRANELLPLYPEHLFNFTTTTLNPVIADSVYTSKAKPKYEELVHELAWLQAEQEWEERHGWMAE